MAPRPQDADPEDDKVDGDTTTHRARVRATLLDRLRAGAPPPRADATDSPRVIRRTVERLDDRERWICFAASGLAVLTGVLIYVVETQNKNFRLSKGELTPQTSLIIGLVTGILLLVATLIGRRAPVGFVSLFVFLAFGTQYFAGIPFLVLAVWLLYRSYKYQKEAAANRRSAMAERPSGASSGRSRGATTTPKATAPKSGARPTKKGPALPEANKRYTPKRPPPPPPKPSRRERKAAQASE